MSNRVTVQYTAFVDLDLEGDEVCKHYGYRIYDDYDEGYNNSFVSFGELQEVVNWKSIWKVIEDYHPDFYKAVEFSGGVFLNDDWLFLEG